YHCTLAGKRALILPRAKGGHPDPVTADHCAAIGGFMAQAHVAGQAFPHHLANSRGQGWLAAAADALAAHLPAADQDLLEDQLRTYRALLDGPPLPVGAIHGDLFTDNCLFVGSTLRAVIDFYNACTDWLLLD